MDFNIPLATGQSVLVINAGAEGAETKETLNYSENVSSCVGSTGAVRIAASSKLGTIPGSSYDVVCIVDPVVATSIDLAAILRILRPDGILWTLQLTVQSDATSKLAVDIIISAFTLDGYVKPHAEEISSHSSSEVAAEPGDNRTTVVYRVHAYKPSYEVGASLPIKLTTKKAAATAWMLAATDIVDDDVIDSDTVLDADDLKKPDPTSLRTCGVSDGAVQRKACKNCTCGLAEQLDAENEQPTAKTSSCGNCYLGDAFRCAACPYRGMPAFKPGQKIELPVLSMQDDM